MNARNGPENGKHRPAGNRTASQIDQRAGEIKAHSTSLSVLRIAGPDERPPAVDPLDGWGIVDLSPWLDSVPMGEQIVDLGDGTEVVLHAVRRRVSS